jgi:hypothetical protein
LHVVRHDGLAELDAIRPRNRAVGHGAAIENELSGLVVHKRIRHVERERKRHLVRQSLPQRD